MRVRGVLFSVWVMKLEVDRIISREFDVAFWNKWQGLR
jgi:hypothetical protein